jgi:hypothetical protein
MCYVAIVKYGPVDEVVKRMGPMGESQAERVEGGANINLNHGVYFTRIVPAKEEPGP